jgi:hypothetical protein
MRIIIMFIAMFCFSLASLSGLGLAYEQPNLEYDHYVTHNSADSHAHDAADAQHDENEEECDDCCCLHSHSFSAPASPLVLFDINLSQSIGGVHDNMVSSTPEQLYRPPRI